ncbi:MAG TPA: hypothetical protein VD902_15765 [Symbiobacteriaceae bacterium]|nr:hypothetical protein [Symbiobacteriaceae bacterium]
MRNIAVLLLAVTLLTGCVPIRRVTGGPSIMEMLRQTEQEVGVPLIVSGPVTQPDGSQIAVYRYQKGNQCGDGYILTRPGSGGGGGRGEGPCGNHGVTIGTGSNGTTTVLNGRLDAPGVARVVVITPDGKEMDGIIGSGVWWLTLPGRVEGRFGVKALDSDGKVVAEAP